MDNDVYSTEFIKASMSNNLKALNFNADDSEKRVEMCRQRKTRKKTMLTKWTHMKEKKRQQKPKKKRIICGLYDPLSAFDFFFELCIIRLSFF